MMSVPQTDHSQILAELENLSRGPFRRVLAKLLANAPSDEAISKQAEAHPDRWGQTTALIARLGGYNERLEVEGSISLQIQQYSDAELVARAIELQHELDKQSSEQGVLEPATTRINDRVLDESRMLGG